MEKQATRFNKGLFEMTIRVRFAPSPTGLLHIGNARTALINWLFVRKQQLQGQQAEFMFRLDDTDKERSQEQFAQAIQKDLAWLGLTHTIFAKQSERFDRYHEARQKLIDTGRLYPCYETPEELDFKRKRQLSRGEPPLYDRAALKLTTAEKAAFAAEGRQPHWRFLLNSQPIIWHDLVRGPTEFHGQSLSDPVLVRGDGAFLYTITSVIDDIDFEITHILRGEDHVTNTAVQIQLFEALGRPASSLQFGHTTLLTDVFGNSLSKRLGSLSLHLLREQGIEAMAINSLLARLGTSQPIDPHLHLDELAISFDLSTFSRTPPHFDPHDLESLNHKILQIMPYDAIKDRLIDLECSEITAPIWNLLRGNVAKLSALKEWIPVFFDNIYFVATDKEYIVTALKLLPKGPWDDTTWSTWTAALKGETGRKGKDLFMPLRQVITGFDHGPEMKFLLPLIGVEKVTHRLQQALK